ncbi:M48 family metallopeptidase [Aminobacter aminovorans]|uniref:M48 family metallopeptidase n=1 Tax=Aminobacter aminovorans TaxID=83263 RepID=UPI0028649302|nr:M48 family metallopeptidase [Aminobacter aminovorans]MDR7224029.1 putative Zn-dependent protease [Aminobacter aminovorans]
MVSEPTAVSGLWRKAGEARAVEARLTIAIEGATTVTDMAGVQLVASPFSAVTISDRVGSIARHLTFPGGGVFETTDNDGVDALIAPYAGKRSGLIHQLERFHPRLLVFVAATVVLCAALYRYAVPVLVEVAVAVTPPSVTTLMSKSALASLDQAIFEPSKLNAERQKLLSEGFAGLVALTPRAEAGHPAYSLNFRAGGAIGPNAFALPDGTVVLTDELVELAGKDDEMILGVLGHEIGHVDHEHSLRQLYRAAGVTALIMLIGGDIGSGTEDLVIQGSALMALSYSRGAESEADRFSVDLMHKAGRDPTAIARFFELLRDKYGDKDDTDFLSTHPATQERIAETLRYAREVGASK